MNVEVTSRSWYRVFGHRLLERILTGCNACNLRVVMSSRTDIFFVGPSSRTDPDDDVVDVTSLSALDVVETKLKQRHVFRWADGVT